jgi:hypothetical protein
MTTRGTVNNVPFYLHANDVKRHIVNVDSRFRDSPHISSASDFYFTLLSPIRNVLRLRISSVEFPNNYFFFTEKRGFTAFYIHYDVSGGTRVSVQIKIPDGNYTVAQMIDVIGRQFPAALQPPPPAPGMSAPPILEFSQVNGAFTFRSKIPFIIDTATGTRDRPFEYGLGYFLGFTRAAFPTSVVGTYPTVPHEITSNICANFAGDSYFFLRVNDYDCVRQTVRIYDSTYSADRAAPNDFTATAKIVIRDPKNYMTYDDANQNINEVVFPNPTDISRLHIHLLDIYGETIDLCSTQFSISIEVLEVKNLSLYNTMRDSLTMQYITGS